MEVPVNTDMSTSIVPIKKLDWESGKGILLVENNKVTFWQTSSRLQTYWTFLSGLQLSSLLCSGVGSLIKATIKKLLLVALLSQWRHSNDLNGCCSPCMLWQEGRSSDAMVPKLEALSSSDCAKRNFQLLLVNQLLWKPRPRSNSNLQGLRLHGLSLWPYKFKYMAE